MHDKSNLNFKGAIHTKLKSKGNWSNSVRITYAAVFFLLVLLLSQLLQNVYYIKQQEKQTKNIKQKT